MPLLNKITTLAAIIFMGTSVALAYLSANRSTGSVMRDITVQEQQQAPVSQQPVTVPIPVDKSSEPGTQQTQPKSK